MRERARPLAPQREGRRAPRGRPHTTPRGETRRAPLGETLSVSEGMFSFNRRHYIVHRDPERLLYSPYVAGSLQ